MPDLLSRLSAIGDLVQGRSAGDVATAYMGAEPTTAPADQPPPEAPATDYGGGWDSKRVGAFGADLAGQYGLRLASHMRTPERNRAVGGAKNSDHLTGMAVDLAGTPDKMETLYRWAKANEGPGRLFRIVLYKYEDPGDHTDHVHLSFNANVTGGGSGTATKAKLDTSSDVWSRLDAIGGLIGGHNVGDVAKRYVGSAAAKQSGTTTTAPTKAAPGGQGKEAYQRYAAAHLPDFGWSPQEMAALVPLVDGESGWNPTAQNPHSTAFGIGQFLNGTWAGTGIGKTSDPFRQIDAMLIYIRNRYGSPARALAFKRQHGWY